MEFNEYLNNLKILDDDFNEDSNIVFSTEGKLIYNDCYFSIECSSKISFELPFRKNIKYVLINTTRDCILDKNKSYRINFYNLEDNTLIFNIYLIIVKTGVLDSERYYYRFLCTDINFFKKSTLNFTGRMNYDIIDYIKTKLDINKLYVSIEEISDEQTKQNDI